MSSEEYARPQAPAEPASLEDFVREGWILHVKGDLSGSEAEFRKAISIDPQSVEGHYGLGLSLKLQRRREEALQNFQKTIDLIHAGSLKEDPVRGAMLRHLSTWHIQTIQSGTDKEPQP